MIDKSRLKDLLSSKEYTQSDKLMICLATIPSAPKQIKEIRQLAVDNGLRKASNWNIASILAKKYSMVVKTKDGWELNTEGRKWIFEIVGSSASRGVIEIASKLRKLLPNITDDNTKEFLEEAIECYELKLYRAAVVLSWIGAVSILHKEIVDNHLANFNMEATKRDNRWRPAKIVDDLGRIKESDFLNIISRLSIIGKSVKQELENCLTLRNSCGHPSTLKINESRVSAHIEILILNVFERFV